MTMAHTDRIRPGPPGAHRPAAGRHRHGHGVAGRARRPARLGDHEPPGQGVRPCRQLARGALLRPPRAGEGGPTVTRALEGPLEPPVRGRARQHGGQPRPAALPPVPVPRRLSLRPGPALRPGRAGRRAHPQAFNPLDPRRRRRQRLSVRRAALPLTNRTAPVADRLGLWALPNFIGVTMPATSACDLIAQTGNRNAFRQGEALQGIFMSIGRACLRRPRPGAPSRWPYRARAASPTAPPGPQSSAGARACSTSGTTSPPTACWTSAPPTGDRQPMASLACGMDLPPGESRAVTFLLTWHFPNRQTWTPQRRRLQAEDGGCAALGTGSQHHRQLLRHPLPRRLGRRRGAGGAPAGAGSATRCLRPRLLRQRPARGRSRKRRSST